MGPEDFQRVAALFDELRDKSEAERRKAMAELPRDLARELGALLERHAQDEAAAQDPFLAAGASLRLDVAAADGAVGPGGSGAGHETPPERVGRFPIVGEIARGGIGVVYRAQDLGIGRDVAVKVLRPEFRADPEMARRLEHEGQIGGRLQHPGIVPVHEVVSTGADAPFLVMRVVEGQTLADLLREQRDRTDPQGGRALLPVFERVCQAIGYSHACGVLHRDLKPSNLMVGEFGEVQVMDWGLASEVGHPDDTRALGTPAYMAPEQARGESTALRPTLDVFGLGGILSEILCGRPPFDGEGTGTVLEQARGADLKPAISRLENCGADPELVELAVQCLATEPEQRPADGSVVAVRMRAYLDGLERRARAAELDAASARATAASEMRLRRRTVALGAGLIVAALLGAFLWLQAALAEQDREREAARRLGQAVLDAESIAASAAAAQPHDVAQWQAVETAARTACELGQGLDEPELNERAATLLSATESRIVGLRLVRRLAELARQQEAFTGLWRGTSALQMRQATAEFLGEDLVVLGAEMAARRLAEIDYREELLRSLDVWVGAEARLDPHSKVGAAVVATANVLDSDPWRERVRRAVHEGDGESLVALAAEIDPGAVDGFAAAKLAAALAAHGHVQLGLGVLERVHQVKPGDPDVTLELAMLFGEAGNPVQFLRFASASVAQQPEQPFARGLLSLALFRSSRISEAIAVAEQALERDGDNQLARLCLFRATFEIGELDRSREHARVIEKSADDSHAMFPELACHVAASYRDAGDFGLCRNWLIRALRSPRMTPNGLFVFSRVRNLPEFLDFLRERSREGDPWDAYLVGRVLLREGEWLEGLRWLERAHAGAPDLPFLAHHLSEVRNSLGSVALSYGAVDGAWGALPDGASQEAARTALLAGVDDAPSESLGAYVDARLAERAGDRDTAIGGYLVVMEADPDAAAPWLHWHRLRVDRDGAVAASRELRAAIDRLKPGPVLPILPGAPGAASPRGDCAGRNVILKAAPPELSGDPRHPHARTLWQVRRLPEGTFELDPVVDLVGPAEVELALPDGLLERGASYAWRVAFVIHDEARTPWSEETVFRVGAEGPVALPLDLGAFVTDDVVVDPGDRENDWFDALNGFSFVTSGFAGDSAVAPSTVRGLPPDGRIGVHRLADLDGDNAVRLAPRSNDLRIPLEPGAYRAVRLLVSSANGNATVGVSVIYEDGEGSWRDCVVPDWFTAAYCQSFDRDSIGTPRWRAMDRIHRDGVEERNAATIFENIVPLDPTRRALAIQFASRSAQMGDANTAPFLFAVTAMR